MRRIAGVLVVCLALAGCLGSQAPVTQIGDDVGSICITARAEYAGYRDWCDVTRSCPAAEKQNAALINTTAQNFCASNPADSTENRAKIRAYLRDIVFLGAKQ